MPQGSYVGVEHFEGHNLNKQLVFYLNGGPGISQLITKVENLPPGNSYIFGCDVKYQHTFHTFNNDILLDFRISDVYGGSFYNRNPLADCSCDDDWLPNYYDDPLINKIYNTCFYGCHRDTEGNPYPYPCLEQVCDPRGYGSLAQNGARDSLARSFVYVLTNQHELRTSGENQWHRFEKTISTSRTFSENNDHELFINIVIETPNDAEGSATIWFDNCYLKPARQVSALNQINVQDAYGRSVAMYDFEYEYLTNIDNDQYMGNQAEGMRVLSEIKRVNFGFQHENLPSTEFEYYTTGPNKGGLKNVKYPNGGSREYIYEDKSVGNNNYGGRVAQEKIYESPEVEPYIYNYEYGGAALSYGIGENPGSGLPKSVVHETTTITDPRNKETTTTYYTHGYLQGNSMSVDMPEDTHQESDYEVVNVNGANYPRLIETRKTVGQKTTKVRNIEFDNNNGLPTKTIEYNFENEPYRCTKSTYYNSQGSIYLKGLLGIQEIREGGDCDSGRLVTKVQNSYYVHGPNAGKLASTTAYTTPTKAFTESYNYDSFGNLISIRDAIDRTSTAVYDYMGAYPIQITNPAGFVSKFAFGYGSGLLLKKLNFDGRATSYEYDNYGRLIKQKLTRTGIPGHGSYCGNGEIDSENGEECDPRADTAPELCVYVESRPGGYECHTHDSRACTINCQCQAVPEYCYPLP